MPTKNNRIDHFLEEREALFIAARETHAKVRSEDAGLHSVGQRISLGDGVSREDAVSADSTQARRAINPHAVSRWRERPGRHTCALLRVSPKDAHDAAQGNRRTLTLELLMSLSFSKISFVMVLRMRLLCPSVNGGSSVKVR